MAGAAEVRGRALFALALAALLPPALDAQEAGGLVQGASYDAILALSTWDGEALTQLMTAWEQRAPDQLPSRCSWLSASGPMTARVSRFFASGNVCPSFRSSTMDWRATSRAVLRWSGVSVFCHAAAASCWVRGVAGTTLSSATA